MSNLFQKARDWLPAQMQIAAVSGNTLTCTLERNGTPITLTDVAWPGQTVFSSNVEGSARIEFGDRDYLVPVASLVFDGVVREPKIGMRFTETIGGVEKVFEVLTPDTGEPAWRYSDTSQTVWRIHCKQV